MKKKIKRKGGDLKPRYHGNGGDTWSWCWSRTSCSVFLQITKLKIDSNPFAKGFRDSSRLTDMERYRGFWVLQSVCFCSADNDNMLQLVSDHRRCSVYFSCSPPFCCLCYIFPPCFHFSFLFFSCCCVFFVFFVFLLFILIFCCLPSCLLSLF